MALNPFGLENGQPFSCKMRRKAGGIQQLFSTTAYGSVSPIDSSMPFAAWDDGTVSYTASADVTVHQGDMKVSPHPVYLKVTGYTGFDTPGPVGDETYDRRYHDLVYLWDFDDPGSSWTAPENVQDFQRDANIAYGPQVAHVYTSPGTYNPSVIVYEPSSGKIAKVQVGPITVKSRAETFPGNMTIYVDDEAIYADAPAGAQLYSNLVDALDNAARNDAQEARCVMLRAGRTFGLPSYSVQAYSSTQRLWKNVYICNDGGSEKPIIESIETYPSSQMFRVINKVYHPGASFDFVITGVHIKASWDSTTETGLSSNGVTFVGGTEYQYPNMALLHDVLMTGMDQAVSFIGAGDFLTTIISDSVITDYRDYAVYGGCERLAFLGSRMTHHVDAMSGGYKNGAHNQHGTFRTNAVDSAFIDGCDFFAHVGWFMNYSPYHSQQPVMRWNFMGHQDSKDMALNMQRCSAEGGGPVLAFSHMNNNKSVRNQNALIERCTVVGSHMTNNSITTQFGGVTVRHNLLIHVNPLRIPFHLFVPESFFGFRNEGLAANSTQMDPMRFEYNTCIDLASPDRVPESGWAGIPLYTDLTYGGIVEPYRLPAGILTGKGNLIHQPNLTTPDTPYAPMTATVLWQPRSNGYKDSTGGSFYFDTPVPAGGTFEIPYTLDTDPMLTGGPLTAEDFAGGQHFLKLQSSGVKMWEGAFSLTFGPTSATVTNLTGAQIETTYIDPNDGLTKDNFIDFKFDRSSGPRPVQRDTQWATPPDSVALWVPADGSGAISGGVEAALWPDFFGAARPGTPTLGAIEIGSFSEGPGSPLPSEIVIMGASIMAQTFGGGGSIRYSADASAKLAALGHDIPIYSYAFGGESFDDFPGRLAEVLAEYPDALIVVHDGGNDVTANKPYNPDPTDFKTDRFITNMNLAFDAAVTHSGKIYWGSLTFRNYNGTTFADPSEGSLPFNENLLIPEIASRLPHSMAPSGRPIFDFYRWMLSDHETWLEVDGVHPNPEGEEAMRAFVTDKLSEILSGSTTAEIPERAYTA